MSKNTKNNIAWLFAAALVGCGGESAVNTDDNASVMLSGGADAIGRISNVGEVDWYQYSPETKNEVLSINVRSNVLRSDVELLATAYQLNEQGEKVRLYADHAAENSATRANLNLNFLATTTSDIYISVRDLRDDAADGFDYKISMDVSQSEDESSSFDDALNLNAACQSDEIGAIGDTDTFVFNVPQPSVVQFTTNFAKKSGSAVDLRVKLYQEDGSLIELVSVPTGAGTLYPMVHFLNTGNYFVLVEDAGRNNFDSYSPFTVCAKTVGTSEAGSNDSLNQAQQVALSKGNNTIEGALDYNKDQDWYELSLPANEKGDFQVLDVTFDASGAQAYYQYEVSVVDGSGNTIMTHIHNSASQPYNSQLKVEGSGPYFLKVVPVGEQVYALANDDSGESVSSASYVATVSALEVDDIDEVQGGNDSQTTATQLVSGADWNMGKIAYRADVDWYKITVPNESFHVLEVFLESENDASGGAVEYSLAVIGRKVERTLDDPVGSDGPTHLKTSILVEPNTAGGERVYFIRVRDFQDDDSDAQSGYRIKARTLNVPDNFLSVQGQPQGAIYMDEKTEQINLDRDTKITLEAEATLFDRVYGADVRTLIFDGEQTNPLFVKTTQDAQTTFTSPWLGGYVDYQGDQDWFKLHLNALSPSAQTDEDGTVLLGEQGEVLYEAQDDKWYYDLKVEMRSAGSKVEYIWKMHYDRTDNQIVNDHSSKSGDGVFASNGDTSTQVNALDLVSGGDDSFWRNQQLKGAYYLKVSDFNITDNQKKYTQYQDYDWGYDAPYYVRLTLVYHSGQSSK